MLFLLLLQDGLSYEAPKGWSRSVDPTSQVVTLSPPEGGQDAQALVYPLSRQPLGSADEFHALLLKSMNVEGASTSPHVGAYQASRGTLRGELRVAVYSAKVGDAYSAAVFVATEKAFGAHAKVVEDMIRGLKVVEPAGPTIHGLVFPPLDGWTRKDDPSGSVVLTPPPPRGPLEPTWDYVMHVLAPTALQGTGWETHRKLHDAVVRASGLQDPVPAILRPDGPGLFIKSSTAGRVPNGGVAQLTLYSALGDGHLHAILVARQEDVERIGELLGRVKPAAPPKNPPNPKVVEAYRRVSIQPPRESSVQYERVWLRADGVADFSTTYPEGYAASLVPAKLDPGLLNGDVGAWKAVGNEIHIRRRADLPAEVYARENGNLRKGGELWTSMPSVDGLRLDGRWIFPGEKGEALARIAFTKDGRFEDDGVLAHVPLTLKYAGAKEFYWPKAPKTGKGRYEIRDFTLLVTYDDGQRFAADVSTLGDDGLLLLTSVLRRER